MKMFFTGLPLGNIARESDRSRVNEGHQLHLQGIPYVNGEYALLDSSSEAALDRGNSMSSSFQAFLTKHECKSISSYLDLIWGRDFHDKVGLEIAGPGRNLFKDLNPGGKHFKRTVGLTAKDIDRRYTVGDSLDSDTHEILEGNAFDVETYRALSAGIGGTVGTQKFDLIIERMWGGLKYAPKHPFELFELLNTVYRLLSDDGVMMIELPTYCDEESGVKVMEEFISINRDDNLDLEFYPSHGPRYAPVLIIRRKNNKARDSLKYVKVSNLIERNEESFIEGNKKRFIYFQLKIITIYLEYLHTSSKITKILSYITELDNYLLYNSRFESVEKVLKFFEDLDLERLEVYPNSKYGRNLLGQAKIAKEKLINILCRIELKR